MWQLKSVVMLLFVIFISLGLVLGIINAGKHSCAYGVFANDFSQSSLKEDLSKCAKNNTGEYDINKCLNKKDGYWCEPHPGIIQVLTSIVLALVVGYGIYYMYNKYNEHNPSVPAVPVGLENLGATPFGFRY